MGGASGIRGRRSWQDPPTFFALEKPNVFYPQFFKPTLFCLTFFSPPLSPPGGIAGFRHAVIILSGIKMLKCRGIVYRIRRCNLTKVPFFVNQSDRIEGI